MKSISNFIIQNNDTLIDSITFYYSGNRGSEFNVNTTDYGFTHYLTLRYYDQHSITEMPMLPDINNPKLLSIQYDSAHSTKSKYYAQYISDTLVAYWKEQDSYSKYYIDKIAYTDSGKVSELHVTINDTQSGEDTIFYTKWDYDIHQKLQSDSSYYFITGDIYTCNYAYDNSGQKNSNVTDIYTSQTNVSLTYNHLTYNQSGNIIRIDQKRFYNNTWNNSTYHILKWDNDGHLVSYKLFSPDDKPYWEYETIYDTNGDPFSRTNKEYDADGNLTDCVHTNFYINSYHNPDSIITFAYQCSSGNVSPQITIYTYETYGNDAITIKHHPLIYPNPARNVVHVRWNKDYSKQALTVKIYNAAGQEMRNYDINTPHAIDDLNTQGLATGTYLLRINTADGNEYIYSGKLVIL